LHGAAVAFPPEYFHQWHVLAIAMLLGVLRDSAMRTHYQDGSLRRVPRKRGPGVWVYRYRKNGKQPAVIVGSVEKYPTMKQAWLAVDALNLGVNDGSPHTEPKFRELVQRYIAEELPERRSTRTFYLPWLNNYILPRWGAEPLSAVQPLAVEDWLKSLKLSPKSRVHIRSLMHIIFECAMRWGIVEAARNPMGLVRIKGATKKVRPRCALTIAQVRTVLNFLAEPFRTMVTVAVCLGLRVSEIMGLQWEDFNWAEGTVDIQRGVVIGSVDDVKTVYSSTTIPLDAALIRILTTYRDKFYPQAGPECWLFPSPVCPELPWSQTHIQSNHIEPAGRLGGIGPGLGWHDFRHTYSTLLRQLKVDVKVQQALLRHADIRTTMNVYTHDVPDELREANSKLVGLVLPAGLA
jgi:integrase